jgi:predicted RNase H-like HicB family nuclease
MGYLVVYQRTTGGYRAFAPDLPGYEATAMTLDDVRDLVRTGIPLHLAGLRADGQAVPEPTATAETVEVAIR